MSLLHTLKVLFVKGAQEAWSERAALGGVAFSYALLIFVWASVWKLIPPAVFTRNGFTFAEAVWYFSITELVTFGVGHRYLALESDILAGRLPSFLCRPQSHALERLAQWFGGYVLHLALFIPWGVATAYFLTGTCPLTLTSVALIVPALMMGGIIGLIFQLLSGFVTVWMRAGDAAFLILHKLSFLFGGLVVPISFYPGWLQSIAWATPFPAMLFAPAAMVFSGADVISLYGTQILWVAIMSGLLAATWGAVVRTTLRTGGA